MRLVAVVLLAAPFAVIAAADPVPCSDPRGCPDLTVDATRFSPRIETKTFTESSCAVQEGMVTDGTRKLLRFSTTTPNVGAGDLIVGAPTAHPEWFTYAKCHNHYHLNEYGDYRLWNPTYHTLWTTLRALEPETTPDDVLAKYPFLRNGFVAGNKLGFCLIDLVNYSGGARRYTSCGDQGISAGWGDTYTSTLDGQWIDITGLAAGEYVLEVEINAARLFVESDYTNNAAWVRVRI